MNGNDDDDFYSPHDDRREQQQQQQQQQSSRNPKKPSTSSSAAIKSKSKSSSSSSQFKYKAMIAPVRVLNCPTIKFGKQYFCRVTRLKDRIEYATPIIKCEFPGTLDFTKFRRSDNRGSQRPPFVTPMSLLFETPKDKRTVTIYIEEYSEFYKHHNTFAHLAPGAIPPLQGDGDQDDENRKVAAVAHFDLINFLNVFENETKGLTNFPIEVKPTETAAGDVTLKMLGARSVIEVDILMHPTRLAEPMWPSPNQREQNFHKLLSVSSIMAGETQNSSDQHGMNNNNIGEVNPVFGGRNSSRRNNNSNGAAASATANAQLARQRTASAKRRLAIAEHAIYRAKIKTDDEDGTDAKGGKHGNDEDDEEDGAAAQFSFGSGSNPLGDANNKKRHKHQVLTPEMQRQIQNALDALKQIQNLRNTVTELESEVADLEERRNLNSSAAGGTGTAREDSMSSVSGASASLQGQLQSPLKPFQSANSNGSSNRGTPRQQVQNTISPSSLSNHNNKKNNNNRTPPKAQILSQQEYENIDDFISNLQQETQMMIGDALSRWDLLPAEGGGMFTTRTESASGLLNSNNGFSPKSSSGSKNNNIQQKVMSLMTSENFVPSFIVPPNAALEKFISSSSNAETSSSLSPQQATTPAKSTNKITVNDLEGLDGGEEEQEDETSKQKRLRNDFLIHQATQMCIETVEKYLTSVVSSNGEIFPNFALPNENEIVEELLKKI